MLQVFLFICCKTRFGCCICCYGYTRMCSSVCFKCFIYVSVTCCKCVSAGCFKRRSREAHVAMAPVAGGQRPAIAACYCCWRAVRGSPCRRLRPADASQRVSASGVRRVRGARSCLLRSGRVTVLLFTGEHAFYAKHALGNDNILMSGGCGTGI